MANVPKEVSDRALEAVRMARQGGSVKRKRRAARIARDSSLGMLVHNTEAQVKSVIAAMERIAPASDDTKKNAVQLVQELWARGLNFKQMMSELRTMYITEMRTLHPSMAKNHLASLVAWNAICDVYVGSQHSVSKAVGASIESFIKAGNYSEAILTAIEFNMPLDRWRSSIVEPKDPCCVSALIEKSGSKTAMARLSYNTYMVLVQALAGKNLSGGTEIERHRAAAMALTASDIADRYGMGRDSFIEAASTSMYLFNNLEHPARDIADILYMRCIRA